MSFLGNLFNAIGDTLYGGANGVLTKLSGNTSVWRKYLTETGNGSVSAAPVWVYDSINISLVNGNQTTTSDSATNITELIIPVEANSRYFISGFIHHGCNNTGGTKFAVDIPASATIFMGYTGKTSSNTAVVFTANILDATLTAQAFNTSNNANGTVIINGEVVTGASAGNIQFMFASGVSGETSTIFQLGTCINICKQL